VQQQQKPNPQPSPEVVKPPKNDPPPPPIRPIELPPALLEIKPVEVEVVFCIDTTGSMGGLLKGAQQKIWSICNQVAGGKPTPTLRVGLVAYRDKGDEYVTKVTDLSRDLDAVQQELMALEAKGGGDIPESVNQALDEAVNRISWSREKKTLKIIFLVGDAEPHMDYTDDVKYPVTCKKAAEMGILINAVQCGVDNKCKAAWQDIAKRAGGEYVAIPQAGGVRVVDTPQDERLAGIVGELMDTALIYGDARRKQSGARMVEVAKVLRGPAAADRAAFAAKSKRLGPNDLLDDLAAKRVKLEDVKEEELPQELQNLATEAERRERMAKLAAKREQLYAEALGLEKERAAHLEKVKAGKDGFDGEVLKLLRKQAKKFDISY
jgi:Mg-chelatase subunit ChlD